MGKKEHQSRTGAGLKNQGEMSRPQYGEVVYGWVFTLIPKGAVRGLGSEGGITHTRAWTHTLTQVRGWLSAVPEGTQWTKWGSDRCFWLPVEPLSSGLRAPAPPGPQGRVEGRKGGVTHELGTG